MFLSFYILDVLIRKTFKLLIFSVLKMENALYLEDSYLKEFEAIVTEVNGNFIVLDSTAFYPISGGQPSDKGTIRTTENYDVLLCKKISGKINHEVDKEGLKVGDKVKGFINWERRYKLMRMQLIQLILLYTHFNAHYLVR